YITVLNNKPIIKLVKWSFFILQSYSVWRKRKKVVSSETNSETRIMHCQLTHFVLESIKRIRVRQVI
ncbi:hypothetical protein, partial [Vibrio parahaemolyticus]|uniref:hypothetical protein n=1 Tax=Vibrio parahaemolyticus TaxID=670 RepID=UPI00344D4E84